MREPRAPVLAGRALGARGTLFFVDDNFVANRGAVARLLPVLRAWQERNGFPFVFCTEASIDLATHPELVAAMVSSPAFPSRGRC